MKKKINLVVSVVLAATMALGLAGCGSSESSSSSESASTSGGTTYLVMGTGGVSGTWYPTGGAIATAMSDGEGISATVQASAGGIENIRTVASGEREIGLATANFLVYAANGEEAFEGEQIDGLCAIAVCMPAQVQAVVRADLDVEHFSDLVGLKVGMGAPGSGDEVINREILSSMGITYDDFEPQLLNYAEQATAFQDRRLDVMMISASAPTATVMDVASQADVKFITFSDEELAMLKEAYPYYQDMVVSKDIYDFMEEDLYTVGLPTMIFTHESVDEEAIYQATKGMYENTEYLQGVHEALKDFSLETASQGITVDIHPGAARYYEEMGVLN